MSKASALLLLLLVFPMLTTAQNIVAIDCQRSWVGGSYSSCIGSQSGPFGRIWCACDAKCGSTCRDISAMYQVYWEMTNPSYSGTGRISGGAEPSAVKVGGSLLLTCGAITKSDENFDREDCNGNRDGDRFELSC